MRGKGALSHSLSLSKGRTRAKIEERGGKVERTLVSVSLLCKYAWSRRRVYTRVRATLHAHGMASSCARHAAGFKPVKAKEYMKETLITALLASQP